MAGLAMLFVVLLATIGITLPEEIATGRVECIFSSTSVDREGEFSLRVEDIPIEYCTHVIYDCVHIEYLSLTLVPSNPEYDFVQNGWKKFADLKKTNPNLKLIMSVNSDMTSEQIQTAEQRAQYIDVIVSVLKEYKFDGVSILWHGYWRIEGSEEGTIYKLFEELRRRFDAEGRPDWEANVMMVIYQKEINYSRICKVADSVSLVSLLDRPHQPNETNVAAPLNNLLFETGELQNVSVKHSLDKWLNNGCPPNKIVLGFPFMGSTFVLADPKKNGLAAPITGTGQACPITEYEGICAYFELCQKFNETGWTFKWDEASTSPYAFKDDEWIAYENVASIERKAEFARSKGLAGVFGMNLANDDYRGKCGEQYPLTKALWRGFQLQTEFN